MPRSSGTMTLAGLGHQESVQGRPPTPRTGRCTCSLASTAGHLAGPRPIYHITPHHNWIEAPLGGVCLFINLALTTLTICNDEFLLWLFMKKSFYSVDMPNSSDSSKWQYCKSSGTLWLVMHEVLFLDMVHNKGFAPLDTATFYQPIIITLLCTNNSWWRHKMSPIS